MRRSNFFIKLISIAIFLVLICYIGYTAYDAHTNAFRTSSVYTTIVEDSAPVKGYIVRDEYIISGSGSTSLLVQDGEKISYEQHVAASYADNSHLTFEDELSALKVRKQQIEDILSGNNSGKTVNNYITELSYSVSRGNIAAADELVFEIEASIFKKYGGMTEKELQAELSSISAQITDLKASLSLGASYISANKPGIFSHVTDGYENITSDNLNNLMVASYDQLFKSDSELTQNAIGKIITGIKWYYAVLLDNETSAKLETGKSYNMLFEDISNLTVQMEVESISFDDAGKRVVVFSSNKHLQDISSLRELKGTIIFDSYSGIKVTKSAVYADDDGTNYLYILRILQAKRVNIKILSETEDYYIIENDGSIPLNAEIIIKANDLYDGKVVQ